jgi:hypothetical protein
MPLKLCVINKLGQYKHQNVSDIVINGRFERSKLL